MQRSLDGLTWDAMTDVERLTTLIPRLDARLAPSMSADPDLARRCRIASCRARTAEGVTLPFGLPRTRPPGGATTCL